MDNRAAISIGLSRLILGLVVGAFVSWIVSLAATPILDRASNATTNGSANQATTWLQDGVGYLPVAFILISAMGIVVLAIFRREVLR
jgi:hypothetical protein